MYVLYVYMYKRIIYMCVYTIPIIVSYMYLLHYINSKYIDLQFLHLINDF